VNATKATKATREPREMTVVEFNEIQERPAEVTPCVVVFETASDCDYIAAGLLDTETLRESQRHNRPIRVQLWSARCIIRYNVESGSLFGLASTGYVPGGYDVLTSPPTTYPVIGQALWTIPMPIAAWESLENAQIQVAQQDQAEIED
jgi:hypothetical protein